MCSQLTPIQDIRRKNDSISKPKKKTIQTWSMHAIHISAPKIPTFSKLKMSTKFNFHFALTQKTDGPHRNDAQPKPESYTTDKNWLQTFAIKNKYLVRVAVFETLGMERGHLHLHGKTKARN